MSKKPSSVATRKSNFVVTFDEKVKNLTSATFAIYKNGKGPKLSSKVTLKGGKKATLNPKKNLKRGTKYTLKLTSRITDAYGNPLEATSWSVRIS